MKNKVIQVYYDVKENFTYYFLEIINNKPQKFIGFCGFDDSDEIHYTTASIQENKKDLYITSLVGDLNFSNLKLVWEKKIETLH
jgi:hypothetical protein